MRWRRMFSVCASDHTGTAGLSNWTTVLVMRSDDQRGILFSSGRQKPASPGIGSEVGPPSD